MILPDTHVWVRWLDPDVKPLPRGLIDRIETAGHTRSAPCDPADRMIIATALHHGIQLASLDGNFPAYQEVAAYLINS